VKGRRTDGQFVLGPPDDVLGARTSDEPTSEQQDLLSRLLVERKEFTTELGPDILIVIQNGASQFRENKGSRVQCLVIVFGTLDLTNRCAKVTAGGLGHDDESDLARWVGRDGSVSVLGGGENSRSHGSELLDKREVDPKALALG
jgi:hypothetical protein